MSVADSYVCMADACTSGSTYLDSQWALIVDDVAQSIALCVVDQWRLWVLMSVADSCVCMADAFTSGSTYLDSSTLHRTCVVDQCCAMILMSVANSYVCMLDTSPRPSRPTTAAARTPVRHSGPGGHIEGWPDLCDSGTSPGRWIMGHCRVSRGSRVVFGC